MNEDDTSTTPDSRDPKTSPLLATPSPVIQTAEDAQAHVTLLCHHFPGSPLAAAAVVSPPYGGSSWPTSDTEAILNESVGSISSLQQRAVNLITSPVSSESDVVK